MHLHNPFDLSKTFNYVSVYVIEISDCEQMFSDLIRFISSSVKLGLTLKGFCSVAKNPEEINMRRNLFGWFNIKTLL